jgi:Ca2+-transporting ATPase
VNDAPALKAAHIGVAMGGRGSDVAREAAALIVTDDDFTSIVGALRTGRRIYDNLRRAMAYVVAVHMPIAGMALLPVLLGWPLVLFPVHIVFLELIVDPACSIAFEAEPADPSLMSRPPRLSGARLLDARTVLLATLQGISVLAATVIAFRVGVSHTGSDAAGRGLAFAALIAGNVALILVNRSWTHGALRSVATPNNAAWVVMASASAMLVAALTIPPVRGLFRFGAVGPYDALLAVALGLGSLVWFEVAKLVAPRWVGRS